jgi:alkanesulfonate monooxygenase SsuD/methylene tetrahydromethanopterin reductase-like flavin-dependent oxidoreductase (luciferase family)
MSEKPEVRAVFHALLPYIARHHPKILAGMDGEGSYEEVVEQIEEYLGMHLETWDDVSFAINTITPDEEDVRRKMIMEILKNAQEPE